MFIIYILILICFPGAISIVIADLVFALGYNMKTRFGLKSEKYKKEDIEFECVNK